MDGLRDGPCVFGSLIATFAASRFLAGCVSWAVATDSAEWVCLCTLSIIFSPGRYRGHGSTALPACQAEGLRAVCSGRRPSSRRSPKTQGWARPAAPVSGPERRAKTHPLVVLAPAQAGSAARPLRGMPIDIAASAGSPPACECLPAASGALPAAKSVDPRALHMTLALV